MALKGNLRDFSLADIFQLIALSRKTGMLNIVRSEDSGHVCFQDGLVSYVKMSWRSDTFIERLIRSGKVKEQNVSRVLETQKTAAKGQALNRVLVDEKLIEAESLEKFFSEQIISGIFELFTWEEGDFNFDSGKTTPEENLGLTVDVQTIVAEVNKRLEEWNKIKKKIPSSDLIFVMSPAPGDGNLEISLKPREWKLLCFLNGVRDIRTLGSDLGLSEFEVAKLLYGMLSVGLVEMIEQPLEIKPAERPAAKPVEKVKVEPAKVQAEEKIEEKAAEEVAVEKIEEKPSAEEIIKEAVEGITAKPSEVAAPRQKEEAPEVGELEEAIKKRADQVVEEITARITQQLLGRKAETAASPEEATAEKAAGETKAPEVKKVEAAHKAEIEVKDEVAVEELEDMLEELTALTGGGESKKETSARSELKTEGTNPAIEVKIASDQTISRNLILKIIKGIKRL